jgi:hypothetical protein
MTAPENTEIGLKIPILAMEQISPAVSRFQLKTELLDNQPDLR